MIKFIVRFIIFLFAFIIIVGFASGLGLESFLMACVFICVWIIIVPFKEIAMWIFFFTFFFSILHYDYFGLHIVSFLGVAIAFDIIYNQLKRSANDNVWALYVIAVMLSIFIKGIMEFFVLHAIFIDLHSFVIDIIFTIILFFMFKLIIIKAEQFIDLYTHGDDMRCHT